MISTYPEFDEVAIVTYGRYAETRLTPTSITNLNRAGISSRLPGKLNQAQVGSVLCAISEASALVSDSEDVETKVTIVNSSPVEDKAELVRSLKSLGQQSEVTLMVTANQWMLDEDSQQLTGINIFHVDEEERKSVTDEALNCSATLAAISVALPMTLEMTEVLKAFVMFPTTPRRCPVPSPTL